MFDFSEIPAFDPEIIKKFDVNGPRYTSYPTADRFHEGFTLEAAVGEILKRQNLNSPDPMSLYFHLPFCHSICYYCACNKIITKDHGRSAKYLKYLDREIVLQSALLGEHDRTVTQLHWGGGSPSFLSSDEMRFLMNSIRKHFNLLDSGEYSIEIDPRGVEVATVKLLGELGFNRISVGVQDFDRQVQEAVNRIQSEAETSSVIDTARQNGFKSVSIDLMYGLPKQTIQGFEKTLDRIIAIAPDRLSIYNYAHLPRLFMPQRRIDIADIPTPEMRLQILQLAIQKLTAAGYLYIGMDHFAKPDDELAVAQRKKQLHRNFQGYSTFADCDMLAFGISSISKVGAAYYQNHKTLEAYYRDVDQQILPVFRGIVLTEDDSLRRAVIQSLMCHFEISMDAFGQRYNIDFKDYFRDELTKLSAYEQAGLIRIHEEKISVLPLGRLLVRTISMVFDQYLQSRTGNYSKVI